VKLKTDAPPAAFRLPDEPPLGQSQIITAPLSAAANIIPWARAPRDTPGQEKLTGDAHRKPARPFCTNFGYHKTVRLY
jgi:hypothetical protein